MSPRIGETIQSPCPRPSAQPLYHIHRGVKCTLRHNASKIQEVCRQPHVNLMSRKNNRYIRPAGTKEIKP